MLLHLRPEWYFVFDLATFVLVCSLKLFLGDPCYIQYESVEMNHKDKFGLRSNAKSEHFIHWRVSIAENEA